MRAPFPLAMGNRWAVGYQMIWRGAKGSPWPRSCRIVAASIKADRSSIAVISRLFLHLHHDHIRPHPPLSTPPLAQLVHGAQEHACTIQTCRPAQHHQSMSHEPNMRYLQDTHTKVWCDLRHVTLDEVVKGIWGDGQARREHVRGKERSGRG